MTLTDAEMTTIAQIGDNNPPEPTPFEAIAQEINDLYDEAKGWLDGRPVTSQGQADGLNQLINLIGDAEKRADKLRKEEVKPFDDGKKEVQARYLPLIGQTKTITGKAIMAKEGAKKALAPWLEKIDAEKREKERIAAEKAEALRAEADAARAKASADDLAAREEADRLADEARKAAQKAAYAAKDKAQAVSGTGRATGLRTYHTAEITDMRKFAQWVWERRRADLDDWMTHFANRLVHDNPDTAKAIPGLVVHEERKAV